MRAAPPVETPSAPGPTVRAAASALAGAAAAVPVAVALPWLARWQADAGFGPGPARFGALLADQRLQGLAALAAGCVAALAWSRAGKRLRGERTLRWDGQAWLLAGPTQPVPQVGAVRLVLDLGPWMLVRFELQAGAGAWLPLRRAGDPARWAALRGALWTCRPRPATHP